MKTKHILFILISLSITFSAEAQFLKKLKKKAKNAAERSILKKTDELVSKKTEKTIEDVTTKKNDSTNNTLTSDVSKQGPGNQTLPNAVTKTGKLKASMLPNSYNFDWVYKADLSSGKKDNIEINYLINSNSNDYFGMDIKSKETKQYGKIRMIIDSKIRVSTLLMDMQGQKMAQMSKIPELDSKDKKAPNIKITEIGKKTILGYDCFGIQVEDPNYTAQMYYTLDAEISFSSLFNMANSKSIPKGFDPALVEVLTEEGLLMEMTATHKKKSKENFSLKVKSIEKKQTNIDMKDYKDKVMPLGGFNFSKGF